MTTMTHSTFKSSLISVGLHAMVLVLGTFVFYGKPMQTLELTGAGGRMISLSNISFKAGASTPFKKSTPQVIQTKTVQTVSTKAASVTSSVNHGEAVSAASPGGAVVGNGVTDSAGTGNGTGNGSGNGHDQDQGVLFSQIKNFFEKRLGSTLNISVEQLIKIKVTLNDDGEVLSADLVSGKLDFSMTKRILNTAKNIPLKNFWKSSAPYPRELVIPLVLTPS